MYIIMTLAMSIHAWSADTIPEHCAWKSTIKGRPG